MTIRMYDLAAADPEVRFSPNCWRIRMALAHKGIAVETVPWRFTDKEAIAPTAQGKVPVIVDGDRWIAGSWAIAEYLDEVYPHPPLFANPSAKAHIRFLRYWTETVLHPGVLRQIMVPLFGMLAEQDKPYFRKTREARFGMTLEEFGADAEAVLPAFRGSLEPLRLTLGDQEWLGGEGPDFGDYIVFGPFQWARCSARHDLLAADDAIADWRERMLRLFDALATSCPAAAPD